MFNNATSISFRGGEVKQIVRVRDNVIIYQKEEEYLPDNYIELDIYGDSFTINSLFSPTGHADWGDNSGLTRVGDIDEYSHQYAIAGNYTIKIYNVEHIYEGFSGATNVKRIVIPETITLIDKLIDGGEGALLEEISLPSSLIMLASNSSDFIAKDCPNLKKVYLNWTDSTDILPYQSNWFQGTMGDFKFIIPQGTINYYIAKGYPSNLLIEDNYIEIQFTGSSFQTSSNPFTYTGNIFIDWGDNIAIEEYVGGSINYDYENIDSYIIKIYGNITSFNNKCFEYRNSLTNIIIPPSVTSIGDYCFRGCTHLTSITIPSSVTSIGNYCFDQCTRLTSITIPLSVISIGNYCFNDCNSLTSITIPSNVTSIGAYCFDDCTSLIEMTLNWNTSSEIITYNSNWFAHTSNNIKFIVPSGTILLYIAKNYPLSISIDLTSTKSILSYANNESCVLTATVLDNYDNPVEGIAVELYKAGSLWDTLTTNSNGEISKTYVSTGVGDVVFEAKCQSLTDSLTIEDCKYWKSTELSLSGTNKHQMYDSNLSMELPTNCEISFDVQIPNAIEGNDYRYWFIPKSSISGMTYPTNALMFDKKPSYVLCDEQLNGSYRYGSSHKRYNTNTGYINFKYIKNGTTIKRYVDNTFLFEDTVSWINNYSDYTLSLMKWSGTATMYIKNVKFKIHDISLSATNTILSYADGDSTTFTATHSLGTGKTVKLYNASDDSLIGTMTDNLDGTYSYTYNSQGIGDLNVYASDGNLVSKTYTIRDVHYYADYNKIKSTWTKETSGGDRTIYNYLNDVGNSTVEFKLKNNVPTSYLMGIGKFYNGGQVKSIMFNNNGKEEHWYSTDSKQNATRSVSQTITSNTVFKFVISNTNTISFYVDDVLVGTDDCRSNFSNYLCVGDFINTPLDLDYVIVA